MLHSGRPTKGGKVQITAKDADSEKVLLVDKVDVGSETARARFIKKLGDKYRGIDQATLDELAERLEDMGAAVEGEESQGQTKPQRLIAMVLENLRAELFKTPNAIDEGECYATIPREDHAETWPLLSSSFRRLVQHEFFKMHRETVSGEHMTQAIETLAGMALYEGVEHEVAVRVGGHDGKVYVDLVDDEWRVIEVDQETYRVINATEAGIRFVRFAGMQPLPVPEEGGSLDDLLPLLNIKDRKDWVLTKGVMISPLNPKGPFPIFCVDGEENSAKSTTTKVLRRVIDPNEDDLRIMPDSAKAFFIMASCSWVIVINNITRLSNKEQDMLCAASTGGAFSDRKLYKNNEENRIRILRPLIINGIGKVVTNADCASRTIPITLTGLSEAETRTEAELWEEFDKVHPQVLGALLNAVSIALRRYSTIRPEKLPRMADFSRWVIAAEPGLGVEEGEFLEAYLAKSKAAGLHALDANPVGSAIVELGDQLAGDGRGEWVGTLKQLLEDLNGLRGRDDKAPKPWPAHWNGLKEPIRRAAPALRAQGITVTYPIEGKRPRNYRLSWSDAPDPAPEPWGVNGEPLSREDLLRKAEDLFAKDAGRKL